MASLGCPDREIATYFGVKEDTLRRHFTDYLTKGRQHLKTSLRQAQIRLALEGNAVMLIWLGKNLLQQNDQGTTSEDARPLPWTDSLDDDELTADEDELDEEQMDVDQGQ
jgi:AraC-like DNA-binding protein